MAIRVISNAGGNWTNTACWVGGVVPVSGDSVSATNTSGSVNLISYGTTNLGFLDLRNYTAGRNFTGTSTNINIINKDAEGYGIRIPAGINCGSVNYSIFSECKIDFKSTFGSLGIGRTCELASAIHSTGPIGFSAPSGSNFLSNNYPISASRISISAPNQNIDFGTSTIRLKPEQNGYDAMYCLNEGNAVGTNITASASTFEFGVLSTYNNVISLYLVDKINFGTIRILAPNNINGTLTTGNLRVINLEMMPGSYLAFQNPAGSASIVNFRASGTPSQGVILSSFTGFASIATLYTTSEVISGSDYVTNTNVKIIGTPTGKYYLGSHSTKTVNATGWILRDGPSISSDSDGMMIGFVV